MRVTFRATAGTGSCGARRWSARLPLRDEAAALQNIAEQLQLAMVPVFDGGDVTLSKSYFVN